MKPEELFRVQVRDGACLATAGCVAAFPGECQHHLPVLYPLWFHQLDDNVWSVRAHAAVALADVVKAYPLSAFEVVMPVLRYDERLLSSTYPVGDQSCWLAESYNLLLLLAFACSV